MFFIHLVMISFGIFVCARGISLLIRSIKTENKFSIEGIVLYLGGLILLSLAFNIAAQYYEIPIFPLHLFTILN